MTEQLLEIIAQSQDGNPLKRLREAAQAGRVSSISDNLDRLLADCVNHAVDVDDLAELRSDLIYAAQQLGRAAQAVNARLIDQRQRNGETKTVFYPW